MTASSACGCTSPCSLRAKRCAIVCSAGNDATDRPTFPAALWKGGDASSTSRTQTTHRTSSVGALNPNGSVALFSNVGTWVTTTRREPPS